ncbi:MAG TPA: protein translocase subunit SecF [Gemmataceae bacterium]|nr:protein translocase subunit SecF [Terriglobales bacterium]HLN26605.1 protein translocase subunit SecF [Gemmataceae bacterium]
MEFFRDTNIDFLGKKWYFLTFSLIFSVAGVLSMAFWHGIPLGVDFRGGTLVYVKYAHTPDPSAIHSEIERAGLKNARVQRYGQPGINEVLIALDIQETSEQALDKGKIQILQALESHAAPGKQDLNNSSSLTVANYLLEKDPLHLGSGSEANPRYTAIAQAIVNYRDKTKSGVLGSISNDELKSVADPAVVASLQDNFYVSDFGIRNVEIVGPQVGQQLRKQAILATLYSLGGMLIYLGFRFEWIYGVAAVLTVFHDTLITVGAFSLLNWEISLTVIAAILTLIGYSNNDTIVVFDRIRENIKLLRREKLADIVNKSINQTLSRTILTAGLTFLTVLALFLFGGEVLHGFSFALVIGILIGTYSSIAIAAPILVAYQDWRGSRGKKPIAMPLRSGSGPAQPKEKVKV